MGTFIDRTGMRYGRLTVLHLDPSFSSTSRGKRLRWLCRCDCGGTKSVSGHELTSGCTTSCGCLRKELLGNASRKHGMNRTPTYRSWQAMKERCYNVKSWKYKTYGGAGILVCDRWLNSFEAFLEDMGERPEGSTLDRIDNTKGYNPENVRWADARTQRLNRTKMKLYLWDGHPRSIKEIAEMAGVPRTTLNRKIRAYPSIEDAVTAAKAASKTPTNLSLE